MYIVIRLINLLFGLAQLALILRMILQFFNVSPLNPFVRFLALVTDPLVRPVRSAMGGRGYGFVGTAQTYVDFAPVVALFSLWLVQLILNRALGLILDPPLWLLRPGEDFGFWLAGVINVVAQLYILALMIRVVLQWFQISYTQPVMRFVWTITEPLLGPIRRRVPVYAGMDFSPVVAFLVVVVVEMLLVSLVQALF